MLQEGGRHRLLSVHVPAEGGTRRGTSSAPDQGPRGAAPPVSGGSPVLGWGPARVLGVGVGRGHGEGGSQGCGDALSRWSRSTIRNAHSIHQRSRKRLSQDAYRRNSVRFLQQRRGLARPGPQSECGRGGAGTRAVGGAEGSGGGVGGRGRPEGGARGVWWAGPGWWAETERRGHKTGPEGGGSCTSEGAGPRLRGVTRGNVMLSGRTETEGAWLEGSGT